MKEENLKKRLAELNYLLEKVNKNKSFKNKKGRNPEKDLIDRLFHDEKKVIFSKKYYADIKISCGVDELLTSFGDICFLKFRREIKKRWGEYSEYILDEVVFFDSLKYHFFAEISFISNQTLVYYASRSEGHPVDIDENFFKEFNVLYELLLKRIEYISNFIIDILDCFIMDYFDIESVFGFNAPMLIGLNIGFGDSHSKGRKVSEIKTNKGSIVFKPRENHEVNLYYDILTIVAKHSGIDFFDKKRPKILIRTNHSWNEFINANVCESSEDVNDFYYFMGYQAAVLHAINGVDCHYENIIASGRMPYFIDLECISQPFKSNMYINNKGVDDCFFNAFIGFEFSVLSLGLFPKSPTITIDNSGISMPYTKIVSRKKYKIENEKIIQSMEEVLIQRNSNNIPRINGENVSFYSYVNSIKAGFASGYLSVIERKAEIFDAIIRYQSNLKIRILFKNTKRYFDLIKLLRNPLFQRNGVFSELFCDSLWDEGEFTKDYDIPGSEIYDILNMDIPYFYVKLCTFAIFDSRNRKKQFKLQMSPFQAAIGKIESMSNKKLAYQLRIISASLSNEPSNFMNNELNVPIHKADFFITQKDFFETSLKILDYIEMWSEQVVIKDHKDCIFWPMLYSDGGNVTPSPMNSSLYNGAVGFGVLYLSYFKVTHDKKYLKMVDMIDSYINFTAVNKADFKKISGYFGIMSYIYFVANAFVITKNKKYAKKLELAIMKIPVNTLNIEERKLEFLDGISGALTILLNVYNYINGSKITIKKIINNLSGILIDELKNANNSELSMTGFAHGLSGILFSLAKVYELFPNETISLKIHDLLNAENELMIDDKWLDMRQKPYSVAPPKWCHGDAGILLARNLLMSLDLGEKLHDTARDNAENCLKNIYQSGFNRGYSLCHGNIGNLICVYDSLKKQSRDTPEFFSEILCSTINEFVKEDFLNQEKQIDLSMMTGLSGVCYALLYFIDDEIPNVLTLELAKESGDLVTQP